ncbi:MAG: GNAT family N-acetyltransferase, partial [Victivallales bacterium]
AVSTAYRKLGIGKELTSCCLKALHRLGIPKCSIFLFRNNTKGKSFWKHNGWEIRDDLSVLQKMTNSY